MKFISRLALVLASATAVLGDTPEYSETIHGLPASSFKKNPNCQDMGYSFGWKMDSGCKATDGTISFEDPPMGVTGQNIQCSTGGFGGFKLACDDEGIVGTITPNVDTTVIMKGGPGGVIYTGLEAGSSYAIDVGQQKQISHIEFCFTCPEDDIELNRIAVPQDTPKPTEAPTPKPTEAPTPKPTEAPAPGPASSSGDPHFKTWTGEKFDYHGECDLVLVDNPHFADGLGLKVHIRTTRVSYFSFIETVALQIGPDVLEFNNDVSKFLINGEEVKAPLKMVGPRKVVTTIGDGKFQVRRFLKAISIRLDESSLSKIDLIQRQNGFPAVVLDGANTDVFQGSLGLLGDFSTGKKMGRDGVTEVEDATEFALEWQVRDTEPLLFSSARYPQYPTVCTPPKKIMGNRLGMSHMKEVAEKACAGWKEDKEDCIFDVIATRDVLAASEGSVVA